MLALRALLPRADHREYHARTGAKCDKELPGSEQIFHAASAHDALWRRQLIIPICQKWITPLAVYASWCVIAVIGALGYWLHRKVSRAYGLMAIAICALLGFGGLDHYVLAPIGAHSVAMNVTIIAEVSAASALLIFIAYSLPTSRKRIGLS
jgi:hypothetical protein